MQEKFRTSLLLDNGGEVQDLESALRIAASENAQYVLVKMH